MTVITTYIAEDGTKFDTKYDCEEYEDKLKAQKFADTAFLYDKNGKQLPMTTASFEEACYIVARTERAAVFMADLFEGWCHPWSDGQEITAGCWVYNGEEWVTADTILNMAHIVEEIS